MVHNFISQIPRWPNNQQPLLKYQDNIVYTSVINLFVYERAQQIHLFAKLY